MSDDHEEPDDSNQPDLLGTSELDADLAAKYADRRRLAAINVLGELSAKSEEFERRQGELNGSFLMSLASRLPNAGITYRAEQYDTSLFSEAFHGVKVKDLSSEINFRVADQKLEAVDGELLAEIGAARAATVWINSKRDRVIGADIQGYSNGKYSKAEISDELILPYLIIGQKAHGDSIDVLFMPLLPAGGGHTWGSQDRYSAVREVARIPVEDSYVSDTLSLYWQDVLLTANMRKDELEALLGLQETLYDLGMKSDEVEALHDSESGTFKLDYHRAHVVRAGESNGLHLPSHLPDSTQELLARRFALRHTAFVSANLSPIEFRDFDVLKHAQRAAAMLGQSEAFDQTKDTLVKKSLADPNGKWFDDTTATAFNPSS